MITTSPKPRGRPLRYPFARLEINDREKVIIYTPRQLNSMRSSACAYTRRHGPKFSISGSATIGYAWVRRIA